MRTSSADDVPGPASTVSASWLLLAPLSSSSPGKTVQPTGSPVRDTRLWRDGWAVLSVSRRAAATRLLRDLLRIVWPSMPLLHLRPAPNCIGLWFRALCNALLALAAVSAAVTAELRCCEDFSIA